MSYSRLSSEEQDLYLEVLREGTTPFDRFVSRGDVEDPVDVPNPRRDIDRAVMNAIKRTQADKTARFIPILGVAGSGKTHAYWAYKDMERKLQKQVGGSIDGRLEAENQSVPANWTIVYIPSPPTAVRMLFHIYTCIITEVPEIIDKVAKGLIKTYGGEKKRFSFGKADIDEVIAKAASDYPGVFADCVKTLITVGMSSDDTKRQYAKRWLLGEVMDEPELDELKIQSVIEQDDVCLAMIKLIADNLDKVMVLYFDEFESPYRTYGPEAEVKFLETIKRIYNEVKSVVIVAAILKDIWDRVLEVADEPFKSRMEPEVELNPFSFGDIKVWFGKSQEHFWEMNNLTPPMDPLFPLNENVLKVIYERTHGNPREIIKLTRVFIDKIINGDLKIEEITDESVPEGAPAPASEAETPTGGRLALASPAAQTVENIIDKEGLIIDVNPASILGSMIKALEKIAKGFLENPDSLKFTLDYKFFVGQKEKDIGALIELDEKKIGIDVPSVKTFDRSGGVAAFYSAKRLVDGITNNTFETGVIIMPESTSGEKTQYLFEHTPTLLPFKLNQKQAEELIHRALDPEKIPSKEAWLFFNIVTGKDVPLPPELETTTEPPGAMQRPAESEPAPDEDKPEE
jgi:hypothetical protein